MLCPCALVLIMGKKSERKVEEIAEEGKKEEEKQTKDKRGHAHNASIYYGDAF